MSYIILVQRLSPNLNSYFFKWFPAKSVSIQAAVCLQCFVYFYSVISWLLYISDEMFDVLVDIIYIAYQRKFEVTNVTVLIGTLNFKRLWQN